MVEPVGTRGGQIITFYSFKGGVGRTMALANVAFLAAMNGLRVLVMDWDLEAPGLDYYFRGLSESDKARAIKSAPGVLNLAWGWKRRILDAREEPDVDRLLGEYERGDPFRDCVCSILDDSRCEPGSLDIIGAGSKIIEDLEPLPYGEALARFSWTEFFENYGGGFFIERMRNWAKANYDLVLIDSRTGFADVAGVCTIQLPDTVALSFIFNRQNIEGIADVARNIHGDRGADVKLRAVPMRVSRQGLLDDAEARSRAATALQRSGAFTAESVRSDLETLGIRASLSVPFYETIAPFATASARDDQLSLDYRKLAEAICGRPMQLIEVPPSWRESVSRRLEYKTVTLEYLEELRGGDPARATEEIERLLEGAVEAELYDGGLERNYLIALVDLAMDLDGMVFEDVEAGRVERIAVQGLDLLRTRFETDPLEWAWTYASYLEYFDDLFRYNAEEAEQEQFLRRYDDVMSVAPWDAASMVRRAGYRRRLANFAAGRQDFQTALSLLDEAQEFLHAARMAGDSTVRPEETDILVQRAGFLERMQQPAAAKAAALAALKNLEGEKRPDRQRVAGAIHLLLLRLEDDPEIAIGHLTRALEDELVMFAAPGTLAKVVQIVTRSRAAPNHALSVIQRMAPVRSRARQAPATFFSRTLPYAKEFVTASAALGGLAASKPRPETAAAIDGLLKANSSLLILLTRRYTSVGVAGPVRKEIKTLLNEATTLVQIGSLVGISTDTIDSLIRAADGLNLLLHTTDDG
ncbi:MAG: hypothetical protein KF910_06890 [Brevundimonas sp.]|uniref:KGGVGR-motif variant AAA ATPase n=1 Tax=Brevundimonas sp. TaxID=1871086 RepID=UPI0025BA281E|nr:AAA family ATPase [Brevundimonas sp.]MBX3477315.1 hypothetical protein [Brevundimonas sp.]